MNTKNLTAFLVGIVQLFFQEVILRCLNLKVDNLVAAWK